MSENVGDSSATGAEETKKIKVNGADLAEFAGSILEDCLFNIIHDIVLSTHRSEKLLRMSSAAVLATQAAEATASSDPSSLPPPAKGSFPQPPPIRVETPGAVYDNGRIHLRGNPFKTTPEVFCPQCKLPRLLYPISGAGSRVPDFTKEYCTKHPFQQKPGHDIYGIAFPVDQSNKTKKERELLKQQQKAQDGTSTPGSQDSGALEDKDKDITSINKLAPTGKGAHYIPWHTCPNCKRSLLITRFAQHLEKCLGISGRQSSRNALAKIQGSQNGTQNGTPSGSRMGTPAPAGKDKKSPVKKGAEDDEEEEAQPLKKKKKSSYIKKADRERMAAAAAAAAASGGQTSVPDPPEKEKKKDKVAAKRLPKAEANGKREREDDEEAVPATKKKQKVGRQQSFDGEDETGSFVPEEEGTVTGSPGSVDVV
ncbi:hypothetical protein M501DRAFT_1010885 [Patellaria atrata CBS 101060]|uniref:SAGA-associated factor 11 n=1 Tax=Patellaria atrata CBS 101060 TaxID=1346257 RepID=A0A9P4SCI7_9PEZI|nr:hypothetical protein M501DRAFT_1010885 [Patellaria atrata CBS 101060]